MEYEVGIDEAGRGPVIGPMVYACCAWPINKREYYGSLGFADSKTLTEAKRDHLYSVLQEYPEVIYKTCVLSPEDISNPMLARQKVSLNAISMESAESLIRQLISEGLNVKEVYVDTVGRPETYQDRLCYKFPRIEIKVSIKADSLFSVVSAASIVAKVTRDSVIKDYSKIIGDIGSGYPSDPNTVEWLRKNMHPVFGFPSKYVRISWKTCTTAMEKLPSVSWPEEQEETLPQKFYYSQTLGLSYNIT